jgi:hypothetical protein
MTFTRCRLGCSVRIRLTATILWQQPPGTHYQWILFYQGFFADFFNTPTENSTSVEVYAVGCTSNRGQVKLSLVYSFEFGNLTYYCDDTSDAYYAPGVSTDPGYSQITCHRPDHVDAVAHANMSHAGGPPWSRRDIWAMELWSGLYPFKEIDLQERFPSLPTTFDPPPTPRTRCRVHFRIMPPAAISGSPGPPIQTFRPTDWAATQPDMTITQNSRTTCRSAVGPELPVLVLVRQQY